VDQPVPFGEAAGLFARLDADASASLQSTFKYR
jgi:hypothetical protein